MNHEKFYSISLKIFILSSAILIFIELIPFLTFLPFTTLTGGGCNPLKICDAINANYVLFPLIFISLISGIIILTRKSRTKKKTALIIAIIFVLIVLFLTSLNSVRCKSYDLTRKADLRQISSVQELFYSEFERYANNYEELSSYLLFNLPVDPKTEERYADADGEGLEGGDSDPNTWSVRVWIDRQLYNYCIKTATGYWYVCNQDGCSP